METNITKRIKIIDDVCANIDYWYGPWNNTNEACQMVPRSIRAAGRTVGIYHNGDVVEYWWKNENDLEDSDLQPKIEDTSLTLIIPDGKNVVTENSDNKTFTLEYILKGKTILREGKLLLNGVLLKTFTPQISDSGALEIFDLPSEIGEYQYRLLITDIFGQTVTSEPYTLRYGTIRAVFNTQSIKNVIPKTPANLANVLFQATINTIDVNLYKPKKILFGDEELKVFDENDQFPWQGYLSIPADISAQNNACAKLIYTGPESETELYIEDDYKINIIPSDSASVEVNSSFSGYVGKQLSIPFTISSGNSTFRFNVTLTVNETTYTYTNAPGNIPLTLNIVSLLPETIFGEGETSKVFRGTFAITEVSDALITDTKNVSVVVNKIMVPDPYTQQSNYFILNTNKSGGLLINNGFNSDFESATNTPIVYYKQSNKITSVGSPDRFVLDTYVNISKSGLNKSIINVVASDGTTIAEIKEEQVLIGNMTTDLYLENNWKHIGIVYNKKEKSSITNNFVYYSAIYIDGKLVKNDLTGENVLLGKSITININPNKNAVFDLSSIHVYGYGANDDQPSIILDQDLLYRNYQSNLNEIVSDPHVLKLLLININNLVNNTYKTYNKDLRKLVGIGKIGTKKAGIVDNLLEMLTAYKNTQIEGKKQQKALATFCYYKLTDLDNNSTYGAVEMHTQGTSTLDYSIPNFAFTFYDILNETLVKSPKQIVGKIPEGTLTAKADYMDSSHLNNTPTCIFYNSITANDNIFNNDEKSYARSTDYVIDPSNKYKYQDAISGEPCIIEYIDGTSIGDETRYIAGSFDDLSDTLFSTNVLTNLGSFMLNIDKSGKSLGLDIIDESEESYFKKNGISVCYSLEGKSNIDNESDEDEKIPNAALFVYSSTSSMPDLSYDFTEEDWNNLSIEQLSTIKNYIFDGSAFEFRSDLDPEDWETKDNLVKYLYPIARMWYFVARSTDLQFKENFDKYFNKKYAFLYYINLMCFAQVDNLGKNSMFDSWDGLIWFPRPYDLDSQCGFTNLGLDTIKTYEEILPTDTFASNSGATTDLNTKDSEGHDTTEQTIEALGNKRFSSKNSNLWKKLWSAFGEGDSSEIKNFYKTLRENGYSAEAVIDNAKACVIDKIPANQYNIDFRNKYLGATSNDDQLKAFGDRWDRFRYWITKRFDFCDSYFGYADTINSATRSANYTFITNTPQYVSLSTDSQIYGRQLMLQQANIPASGGVVMHVALMAKTITEIKNINDAEKIDLLNPSEIDVRKLDNLLVLDLSNNKNIQKITGLYTQFNFLHTLNISNSVINSIGDRIPSTILNLYADNVVFSTNPFVEIQEGAVISKIPDDSRLVNLSLKGYKGSLVLSNMPLLESVDLEGAQLEYLKLENLPNLTNLNITNCTFNGNVQIINVDKEELDFSYSNFDGNALDFSGGDLHVKKLILSNVRGLTTINLDTLVEIEELDCSKSSISQLILNNENTTLTKFYSSEYMRKIGNTNVEDGVANMSNFKSLSLVKFTDSRMLKTISDLSYKGDGYEMFFGCNTLEKITNSDIRIVNDCRRMFVGCWKLSNISNVILSNNTSDGSTNVIKNILAMFVKTHNLPLTTIRQIINTVNTITSVNSFCAYKCNMEEIDLDSLFDTNNPETFDLAFTLSSSIGDISVSIGNVKVGINLITERDVIKAVLGGTDPSSWTYSNSSKLEKIVGKFPSNIKSLSHTFHGNPKLKSISRNIFEDCGSIETLYYTFASCDLTNNTVTENGVEKTLRFFSDNANTDVNFWGNSKNTIKNLLGTFSNNKNLLFDITGTTLFNLANLETADCMFLKCTNVSGDCTAVFEQCNKLKTIECCFMNTGVYLARYLFSNDGTNSHTIPMRIGGLFGNNTNSGNSGTINVDFLTEIDTIDSLSASVRYSDAGASVSIQLGLFEGCKNLYLFDDQTEHAWDLIKNKFIEKDCTKLFKKSNVYSLFELDITELLLPQILNGTLMFYGCNLSPLSNLNKITFANTGTLKAMFAKTVLPNNSMAITFTEGPTDLSYLFAASTLNFNISNLLLPSTVETTVYMFARRFPSSMPDLKTAIADTTIDAYYNMNKVDDILLRGVSYETITGSGASGVQGTVPVFGSSSNRLSNLKYTGHMFDQSAISSIKGGLFHYCPAIIDCRYMFSQCRNLTNFETSDIIDIENTSNIFTALCTSLIDVTGMFRNTSLAGALSISLKNAPNLLRADCMFEYIFPDNSSPIVFQEDLFTSNNSNLRSISCIFSKSHLGSPIILKNVIGVLLYTNYAFANSGISSAKIFCDENSTNVSNSVKSMKGMFIYDTGITDTDTDIDNVEFLSTVVKTGNFANTNTTASKNKDKITTGISSEITMSKISYAVGSITG